MCTVPHAQKYTGACHGGTQATKMGNLCSNRAGQDDCGQCWQHVLSFPALTDLRLEPRYCKVLWQQAPFAKGYLSPGSQRCSSPSPLESSQQALIQSTPFRHVSGQLPSLFASWITCGGVPKPGGVLVAGSCSAPSMLAHGQWCSQAMGQLMCCSFN